LFQGTIRENIRYGRLDATDDEVEEAAKMGNAHEFILRLPDQYNTQVFDFVVLFVIFLIFFLKGW
jgi:ATP-binding cassette, subfamily B, multidrug efflux pump